uniref:PKD domain-containing protein n=1 Tax=candidate division WOR-3 bacterium TaxID=2052148 RepID=A0A7V3UZ43_UNCW3
MNSQWRRVIYFLLLVVTVGCQNQPPSVPILWGPQRGRPNDTLVFSMISLDKEGDSIAYLIEINQESLFGWSQWFPPGIEVNQQLSFNDTGSYILRVKARDSQHESGWSDEYQVWIRLYLPSVPRKPSGPDSAVVGVPVTFYTSGLHPLDELVSFQFWWGDTTGDWSGFVMPGTVVRDSHTFNSAGTFEVRCRAKDKEGCVSGWSAPETIFIYNAQSH